jgi:ferric-dicitrate binding protein FerR (iron transport regulator)
MKGHLIVLALAGEATSRQRAEVERWCGTAAANAERYARRARLWALIGEGTRETGARRRPGQGAGHR